MKVRCPKHGVVFNTKVDHKLPGAPEEPSHCHTECPIGSKKAAVKTTADAPAKP